MDYCDGIIKAVGLVKYARFAKRDGLDLAMIDKFAKCGGVNYANASHRVKATLRAAGSEEYVRELGGNLYKYGILPSDVIKLIGRSPGQFKVRLAPSADAVERFWEQFFSSETDTPKMNRS